MPLNKEKFQLLFIATSVVISMTGRNSIENNDKNNNKLL